MNTITYECIYHEQVVVKGNQVEGWLFVSAMRPTTGAHSAYPPFIQLVLEVNDEACETPDNWDPPSNVEILPRMWKLDAQLIREAIGAADSVAAAIKRYGWPTFLEEAIELAS